MGDFNLTVENNNLKVFMSTFDSECLIKKLHVFDLVILPPSKHFLFTKMSSRRLEDIFARRLPRRFQDVFKTSSRRVCKTSCYYVFKTSSVRLHQDKCLLY